MSTFITVGNGEESFSRLFKYVEKFIDILPNPIIAQCGNTKFESKKIRVSNFFELRDFKKHIANSEIIICHAGVGTLMQAIKLNKIPICIPRLAQFDEIINDHQIDIAEALAKQKKIIHVKNLNRLDYYIQKSIEYQKNLSFKEINNNIFHREFKRILEKFDEDFCKIKNKY